MTVAALLQIFGSGWKRCRIASRIADLEEVGCAYFMLVQPQDRQDCEMSDSGLTA